MPCMLLHGGKRLIKLLQHTRFFAHDSTDRIHTCTTLYKHTLREVLNYFYTFKKDITLDMKQFMYQAAMQIHDFKLSYVTPCQSQTETKHSGCFQP